MKRLASIVLAAAIAFTGAQPAKAAPVAATNISIQSNSGQNTSGDSASLKVSWTRSLTAVAYSVSASSAGRPSKSGSAAACETTTCTSIISGLTGGINYRVRVTAIAGDGTTTAAPDETALAASVPEPVRIISSTLLAGQVVLTWAPSENSGGLPLSGFSLTDESGAVRQSIASSVTSYTVSNLSNDINYTFLIAAENSLGASSLSQFAAIKVMAEGAAPNAPKVSRLGKSINVSWTLPTGDTTSISGYRVFLVDENGNDVGQPVEVSGNSLIFPNLPIGQYAVQISVLTETGESSRSQSSQVIAITYDEVQQVVGPPINPETPNQPPLVRPLKLSDVAKVSTSLKGATTVVLVKTKTSKTIALGKAVVAKVPKLSKGTRVRYTLKSSKGQIFELPPKVVGANRTFSSLSIRPRARGTYTLTMKVAKITRVLIIYVK